MILQPNGDFSFTLSFPATKNPGDRRHVCTLYVSAGDMAGVGKSQTDRSRSIDAERTRPNKLGKLLADYALNLIKLWSGRVFSSLLVNVYSEKNDYALGD